MEQDVLELSRSSLFKINYMAALVGLEPTLT